MARLSTMARYAVRVRYVLLTLIALACTVPGVFFDPYRRVSDWLIFEIGARTLTHWHHLSFYGGQPLHLYANNSVIQIGPPPLLLVVGTQWLPPAIVGGLWVVLMTLMGVASIAFIEAAARRLSGPADTARIRASVLLAGAPLVAAWGYESSHFHHLDDALALLCVTIAVWLCATGRSAWLMGIALGIAAASKPWAIVMAPVLLGLPREKRAKAALALVLTATAFWGPFIVAAPGTINSLGLLRIVPDRGSVLWLIGVHGHVQGWLRPVQFVLGVTAASYVGLRRNWLAAPLVGMAVRVAFDPYVYAYYGLGPVLGALLWDLTRPRSRRLPLWTAWTLAVEFGVRLVAPPSACAIGRAVWVLSVLGGVVLTRRAVKNPTTNEVSAAPSSAQPHVSAGHEVNAAYVH